MTNKFHKPTFELSTLLDILPYVDLFAVECKGLSDVRPNWDGLHCVRRPWGLDGIGFEISFIACCPSPENMTARYKTEFRAMVDQKNVLR